MTSVYVRKPRDVKSIYARPPRDQAEEGTRSADRDRTSVCQNGIVLNQKSTRVIAGGKCAGTGKQQPGKCSVVDGRVSLQQKGGNNAKKTKSAGDGEASVTPKSKGLSVPAKSSKLQSGRICGSSGRKRSSAPARAVCELDSCAENKLPPAKSRKTGRPAAASWRAANKGSSFAVGDADEQQGTQKAASPPVRSKRTKAGRPPASLQGCGSKGSASGDGIESDTATPEKKTAASTVKYSTPATSTFCMTPPGSCVGKWSSSPTGGDAAATTLEMHRSSAASCKSSKSSQPSTLSESCVGKTSLASRKSSRRKVGRPSTQSRKAACDEPSVSCKSATLGAGQSTTTAESGQENGCDISSILNVPVTENGKPTATVEYHVASTTLKRLKHKIKNREKVGGQVIPDSEREEKSITELKPYICSVCQRRYASDVALREHEQLHTGQEAAADQKSPEQGWQYRCEICSKGFTSKGILTRHRALHSEVKPFVCDTCGKTFSQPGNLKIHLLQHTGERPYVCDVCNKTYLRNFDLQQHKRIHTGERPYACGICGKAFMKMDYLKTHKQVHNGERPFKCDQCCLTFRRNNQLKAHKHTHVGIRSFVCEVCSKAFSTKGILKTHMQTHIQKKDAHSCPICDICGAQIGRRSSLKIHMMIHTGERPYVCEVCNKGFITKNEWQIHKRTHTGERPFRCHICNASYPRNVSLRHHITTVHWGLKPHVCEVCGKAFGDRRTLKEHQLIHTGVRPHRCTLCGKCFTQSGSLKAHVRTHTGEKPFACKFCSKRFSDLGGRNRHIRIHTGEKPYKCSQCPASFARPEPYKQHRQTVHGSALVGESVTGQQTTLSCTPISSDQNDTTPSSAGNMACEAVVVVLGQDLQEVAAGQSADNGMGPVVVQPAGPSEDTTDILSPPTIVVEPTDHLQSSVATDAHIFVDEQCIYTADSSIICEPLPSTYSTTQVPSGSEAIEFAVVNYSDDIHSQFSHEEHEAVFVKREMGTPDFIPRIIEETTDLMPRIIEVQVRNSREGVPPKIIEVIYDGTVAPVLSVAEHTTEHKHITSTRTNNFKVEYVESDAGVAVIESQRGASPAENTMAATETDPQTSHDTGSVLESQVIRDGVDCATGPAIDDLPVSGKTTLLTIPEDQDVLPDDDSAAGNAVHEAHADPHVAETTTTLEVIGSQSDTFQLENGMTVTFIDSQASSDCSPNFFHVFQADGTGSLTIIEPQAAFDSDPADSVLGQVGVDSDSVSRIIDLPDGKSIQIISGHPVVKNEVTDNNSAVEDQKPLLESHDQEKVPAIFTNTNKRFNRRGKPTTMSADATMFGDVMNKRKRIFGKAKKSWICEVCGNGFTQHVSLKKHMAVQHSMGEDQAFVCSTCGKACVSRSELEAHTRRHTGERPFACELCSNTYKHKADLRQHILAGHMGKRPHVCSVCRKSFTEKRSLKDHALIHQGLRPHKCSTCSKAFTQASSLKNHMRVHSGLRPWVCQYCSKDFSDQSTFTRHQRIHTGEKPFQCQHCSTAFARSEQLKKHLGKEHPGDLQNLTTLAEAVATIM